MWPKFCEYPRCSFAMEEHDGIAEYQMSLECASFAVEDVFNGEIVYSECATSKTTLTAEEAAWAWLKCEVVAPPQHAAVIGHRSVLPSILLVWVQFHRRSFVGLR